MKFELNVIAPLLKGYLTERIVSIKKIEKGVMNHMYLLSCENDLKKYVLRVYPNTRSGIAEYEPNLLKEFHKVGAKSARYIGHETTSAIGAFLLYEYIPGRPLNEVYDGLSPRERESLVKEIIQNLSLLESVTCRGFGPLEEDLNCEYKDWSSFIYQVYGLGKIEINRINNLRNDLLDHYNRIFPELLLDDKAEFGLTWLDFHPKNIIVSDDGSLGGFIDFEEVVYGDKSISIAYLFSRVGNTDFYKRILEEYGKQNGPIKKEKIDSFSIFRIFRIAPHLCEELPSGKSRDNLLTVYKGVEEINNRFPAKSSIWKVQKLFLIDETPSGVSNNSQRVRAVTFLLATTLLVLILFLGIFDKYLDDQSTHKSFWANENSLKVELADTPSWFRYVDDTLYSDMIISDNEKSQLLSMLPEKIVKDESFAKSLNLLIHKTRSEKSKSWILIVACGLISIIGVQIRSLWDFVGNASYKNELSINIWWPWYILRPMIGFLAAVVFYFLFSGGLWEMSIVQLSKSKVYIMLGLSSIIGFGLNDFIVRLRMISKAVLGGTTN